ncbi:hypothetical protein [Piscinibacter sp. HJYY11]|uniref:hypothetical protein n=1 Tax=Piscinibacter sp. HJYY11 TaxID=2801333 RepID=UPI00191FAA28|nr:hypothetical protein [Piscinibacter sp. HJYY11]MBL0727123.1 hypothetical protein [Piscinibacter sp. HJYY11]
MDDLPTSRIITSRSEFHDALKEAFAFVADKGCREVFIADPTFADWPLSDRAVIENLSRWAFTHRKLTVLAESFDEFPRRHPRWVEWRRQWSHVVECRAVDEADIGQMSGLFLAPGLITLRVLDAEHYRASLSFDPADTTRIRDALDALLQRSEEAFPVTTLGL